MISAEKETSPDLTITQSGLEGFSRKMNESVNNYFCRSTKILSRSKTASLYKTVHNLSNPHQSTTKTAILIDDVLLELSILSWVS